MLLSNWFARLVRDIQKHINILLSLRWEWCIVMVISQMMPRSVQRANVIQTVINYIPENVKYFTDYKVFFKNIITSGKLYGKICHLFKKAWSQTYWIGIMLNDFEKKSANVGSGFVIVDVSLIFSRDLLKLWRITWEFLTFIHGNI